MTALIAARAYQKRGLRVFPLDGKVPITTNGVDDASADLNQIEDWFAYDHNIGIAIPTGFVVVDVDPRNGGDKTWITWLEAHGEDWLWGVPRARTGRGDGGMHYWFHYTGEKLRKSLDGVDFVRGNKYVVAPPSITNHAYEWLLRLPADLTEVPELPDWLLELARRPKLAELTPSMMPRARLSGTDDLADAARKYTTWPRLLTDNDWHLVSGDGASDGSKWRRPDSDNPYSATMRHDCLFVYSTATPFEVTDDEEKHGITLFHAIETLEFDGNRAAFLDALRAADCLPPLARSASPWDLVPPHVAAKRAELAIVPDTTEPGPEQAEEIEEAEQARPEPAPAGDGVMMTGDVFIWDETEDLEIRWGRGSDVLWAAGESLMLVGPPGVGKTTLAHQLVASLIGTKEDVLGFPVTPAQRVLYLAMDRPKQIRRAMRRLFRPEDREVQRERLLVRKGPLPQDLAKHPEMLIELALEYACDVLVIDSLKDAAIKLSDDETGGGVNRAIQWCNAENVDVCVLHHQRKGQDGAKPTKLDDVYGSAWLTAGTGSVVLLWGEAGMEQVELIHLKQPLDPVGPLNLEHDHRRGTTAVVRAFDVLRYLGIQGDKGATLMQVAQAEHGGDVKRDSAKVKRTERRLRGLVDDGLAWRDPPEDAPIEPGKTIQYFARNGHIGALLLSDSRLDTPVDKALSEDPWT